MSRLGLWRSRRRRRRQREFALAELLATALPLAGRIERTAASFGSARLFDERYGQIELDALAIRKRAEWASR